MTATSTYVISGVIGQLLLIVVASRRTVFYNPAFIQLLFNLGSIVSLQIALWQDEFDINRFGTATPYIGLDPYTGETISIISIISFITFIAIVIGGSSRANPGGLLRRTDIADAANKIARSPVFILSNALIAVVLLFHFFSMDMKKLIFFEGYLGISDPADAGIQNQLLFPVHRALGLLSIVLGVCSVISIKTGPKWFFYFCIGPAFAYCFVYTLGSNSRFAPVTICAMYLTQVILSHRTRVLAHFLFVIGILFTMHTSLEGRAYLEQGIGPWLERVPNTSVVDLFKSIGAALNNIFDGVVVLAQTVKARPSYEAPYTWLSFLPSISLIDGFDSIRSLYDYDLAPNVPVSAIGEAYFFGFPYWTLFLFQIGILYFLSSRICAVMNGPKGLVIVVLIYFIIISISQYSIRTSSRLIYFEIVLMSVMLILRKVSPRRRLKLKSSEPFGDSGY